MKAVRRLLEEDLGIKKKALDVHKEYIEALVDQVYSKHPQLLSLHSAWLPQLCTSAAPAAVKCTHNWCKAQHDLVLSELSKLFCGL